MTQSTETVSQRAREAARNFIGSWPRVSVPTYYEPALAESFARFERELSTNKDETIRKLREALVEAAIPLEALNLNGLDRFSGEMREGILSAIRTIRTALTSTKKEG